MSANYVLLEKVTVGASVSSVTFNNIPQTGYTDLVIKASGRSNLAAIYGSGELQFNSDTGSNYKWLRVGGSGSGSAGSDSASSTTSIIYEFVGNNSTANTFANAEIYIPNYTGATQKSVSIDSVGENNATTAYATLASGLWTNTSAITSIKLFSSGNTILQYSTFSLYGIAAVGTTPTKAPFAAGGDIIQTDGTYWYHAFLSSGTFTPAKNLSCDYVVLAGAGGGGLGNGGGGGAGGYRTGNNLSFASNTNYALTIGAGGAGFTTAGGSNGTGGNGTNSSIIGGAISISGTGGGGGGSLVTAANSGGSGGGVGGAQTGGSGNTGGYSPVEGYNAGNGGGYSSPYYASSGGGGAGGASATANSSVGGTDGGVGAYSALTNAIGAATGLGVSDGTNYYFGGGGGGGTDPGGYYGRGGKGGGGNAGTNGSSGNGVSGTTNTGGGGGGATTNNSGTHGGNGGSGITIIRYLA